MSANTLTIEFNQKTRINEKGEVVEHAIKKLSVRVYDDNAHVERQYDDVAQMLEEWKPENVVNNVKKDREMWSKFEETLEDEPSFIIRGDENIEYRLKDLNVKL